jgi:hypothetical protein
MCNLQALFVSCFHELELVQQVSKQQQHLYDVNVLCSA